ncbi:formyltransferase family protein [Prochlorococcus sp. AH-716-F13]|nr:formyltransferase family protein [Prochlorococcus sp. AH-716-F13]
MRLLICNSKNWFSLNNEIKELCIIKEISRKEDLNLELIHAFKPDYIFFPHWNWIVDKNIHQNYMCIVFHTAPLPYGRGGSPIQNLILNGYEYTPVCALKMTSELDAGPIYGEITISLEGNLKNIFLRIKNATNKLIMKIIKNQLIPVPQEGEPHYFKRLSEKNNEIPNEISLREIFDKVRMLDHEDYPNAYIVYGNNKLEFYNASLNNEYLELKCKIRKLK